MASNEDLKLPFEQNNSSQLDNMQCNPFIDPVKEGTALWKFDVP